METFFIVLVCKGDWIDGLNLSIEGEQQMIQVADHIKEKVLKFHPEIESFDILLPENSAIEKKCAKIFCDNLNQIRSEPWKEEDFLNNGTDEKPRGIVQKLLTKAKKSKLLIAISSKHIMGPLPKEFVNLLSSDEKPRFLAFAENKSNFVEKRGIIINFNDEDKIHGIYPV